MNAALGPSDEAVKRDLGHVVGGGPSQTHFTIGLAICTPLKSPVKTLSASDASTHGD